MTYLLFGSALSLSVLAEYYAIMGLIAIFAGAPISIALMGGALGVSKLVLVSWLYRNWASTKLVLKSYFLIAITILMFLTSMGIFGYLSKAHLEHSNISGDVVAKVEIIDEKIKTEKDNIDVNRKALKQLDDAVDQVMGRSTTEAGADKAVQIRRTQQKERSRLQQEIAESQKRIAAYNEERAPIATELRKVEAEVGPIKYIAALVYGDNADATLLEKAVRWMILLIVSVFDPLAVLMFVAYNQTVKPKQEIVTRRTSNVDIEDAVTLEESIQIFKRDVYTGHESTLDV